MFNLHIQVAPLCTDATTPFGHLFMSDPAFVASTPKLLENDKELEMA